VDPGLLEGAFSAEQKLVHFVSVKLLGVFVGSGLFKVGSPDEHFKVCAVHCLDVQEQIFSNH